MLEKQASTVFAICECHHPLFKIFSSSDRMWSYDILFLSETLIKPGKQHKHREQNFHPQYTKYISHCEPARSKEFISVKKIWNVITMLNENDTFPNIYIYL